MPLVLADRVKENSSTTGTGTFTLTGAQIGFQSFAVVGDGNTTYYTIQNPGTSEWEVGIGTYTSANTTITRTTILASSNSNSVVSFSSGTKDVFVTYPAERAVYYEAAGGVVISDNSTANALRITQTGTGNALVVEDSANPDATPFVVDASGRLVVGNTSALAATGGTPNIQYVGSAVPLGVFAFNSTAATGAVTFARSKSATIGTNAALVSGDQMAVFRFQGADGGTAYLDGAQILAVADGSFTPTSSPGRLVFSTTADGASSPTERMRIDNAGNISLASGGTVSNQRVRLAGNFTQGTTGSGNSYGFIQAGTVQSDVTNLFVTYRSEARTAAASFALGNYWHFQASQASIGAGSSISSQIGFLAENTLTGATNNYGFYSNIASGTGRWNFYANGTAENFFGGVTTFRAANAIRSEAASTQDAVVIAGRAGGTSSYAVTLTPATLASNTTLTLPNVTDTVTAIAATQTLTNKRITPRVTTTTSSATPTINTDTTDQYGLTAQAVDITSFTTNLSGTPTDGQKLWIYIVGTAARAITWGASFEASTVALPTTTVSTNRLDVGFVWNAATSKWRCVATA